MQIHPSRRFGTIPPGIALGAALALALVACGGGSGAASFPAPFADATLALPAATAAKYARSAAGTRQYQVHLDAATANAGTEFAGEQRRQWCYSVENPGAPPELANTAVVPMTKMFDDFYFTGRRWVGQFVLRTAGGYFLLDAQNSTDDAQNLTVPGLASAGFDPRTLKGIMPTHGHGDHFNGAKYMQDTYGGPVYIGSADAAALASSRAFTGSIATTPLPSEVLTPQPLTVDGANLKVLSTPGHTPGTFSGIIPVSLNGKSYKMAFWGGTGTPTTLAAAKQYLDGSERLYRMAESEKVDGTIHTHPFVDGTLAKLDALRSGSAGGANPFLIGTASTLRSFSILRECSAAKVNALDATAVLPIWSTTTTEVVASRTTAGSDTNANISALFRVSDPYGPVAGARVAVGLDGGTDQCTATTDTTGTGRCEFLTAQSNASRTVVARFPGAESASQIQLASSSTASVR